MTYANSRHYNQSAAKGSPSSLTDVFDIKSIGIISQTHTVLCKPINNTFELLTYTAGLFSERSDVTRGSLNVLRLMAFNCRVESVSRVER